MAESLGAGSSVLAVSAERGVELVHPASSSDPVQLHASGTTASATPDGTIVVVATTSTLEVFSLSPPSSPSWTASASLPAKPSALSSTSHHAICFVPPGTNRNGSILTFSLPSLHPTGSLHAKKASYPMLSFSLPDENVCARHESDELCVYRSNAVGDKNQAARLLAQNAAAASMSPDGKHAAVFNPEKKSMPASAKVHALPEFGSGKTEMQPLAMRTFYRAKTASLLWSPSSVSCVVWAASDVDATNKSYYGESGMHVVRPDGNGQRVEVEKEGPVHDVSWSPAGDTFISVQGYLPTPAVCVHDMFGNKKQKVLNDSFNGVAWNRFGNFVALYGFGNLPGDITFLDKKPDGKLKTFASTRMRSHTALEWLADGRHLAISALTPRIREGNGFMIMKYNGEQVFDKRYNELTAVCSVGMSEKDASQFNRPPSPSAKQNRAKGSAEKSEANTYRPAHLKNVQPLPTQQGSFSSDAYKPPKQREEAEGPPGSEGMNLGGGQTKNAKKRERQKKKKQEAGEANGYGGAS